MKRGHTANQAGGVQVVWEPSASVGVQRQSPSVHRSGGEGRRKGRKEEVQR